LLGFVFLPDQTAGSTLDLVLLSVQVQSFCFVPGASVVGLCSSSSVLDFIVKSIF
jgi:hypothetical protein